MIVPRGALFAILRRFGMPDHFVNIVIHLHENALIYVKIGEDDFDVESSIGVRQGSWEGPILILFSMQAATETLTWSVAKPVFRTRSKGVIMGERSFRKRDASSFDLWTSLFADDCAIYRFEQPRRFGVWGIVPF